MKYLCLLFLFLLFSCGEEFALKKEKFYLNPEAKKWKIEKFVNMNFTNKAGDKINFTLYENREDFTPSKTTIAGIPTNISKYEQISQVYSANGFRFTLILTGYNQPLGNLLSIGLNKFNFTYQLYKFEIFRLDNNNQYFSDPNNSGGSTSFIRSTVKFENDYKLKDRVFSNVLIFDLKDGKIDGTDINQLIMAPNIGIIYFKTKDGVEYTRQNFEV